MQRGHPQQTLKGHWKNPTPAQLWRSRDVAWAGTSVSKQKACPQPPSARTPASWPCDAACAARRSWAIRSSTRPGKPSAFAEGPLCKEVSFGLIRILKLVQKFETLPVLSFFLKVETFFGIRQLYPSLVLACIITVNFVDV